MTLLLCRRCTYPLFMLTTAGLCARHWGHRDGYCCSGVLSRGGRDLEKDLDGKRKEVCRKSMLGLAVANLWGVREGIFELHLDKSARTVSCWVDSPSAGDSLRKGPGVSRQPALGDWMENVGRPVARDIHVVQGAQTWSCCHLFFF